MAKKNKVKNRKFNVNAVVSTLKVETGRSRKIQSGIVPYGERNTYPNDVYEATRLSPTGKGCVKNLTKYTFGLGLEDGGDIVVNRMGQTLNDVVRLATFQRSWLNAYTLHFNFNLMGQITEITVVDIRFVRKTRDLLKARIGLFKRGSAVFSRGDEVDIFLYMPDFLKEQITADGGFKKFKGNIYYYTDDGQIYSLANGDASLPSAQLENEVQTFNFASINNSMSASGLIKIPFLQNDENHKKEIEAQIASMRGAANAGSILTMEVPPNIDGGANNVNLFESFDQNNIDKMYVEQVKNAEGNILKEYMQPKILLGVSDNGMFNQSSFQDASDYYNSQTQPDTLIIERSFNNFWSNTVWVSELSEVKINRLPFFNSPEEDNGSDSNNDTGN